MMEEMISDFLIKASKIDTKEEFERYIDSNDIITDKKLIEDIGRNRLPYGIGFPKSNLSILKDKIQIKLIEKLGNFNMLMLLMGYMLSYL
jgi:hypothetical protein